MASVELTESQLKASQLLASGETQVNVAKIVDVNVKTIQRWLKIDLFKADVEKNVGLLKSNVEKNISQNINPLINRIMEIALKSDSDKTSLDACIYAINRVCGTPTNKTQDITGNEDKEEDKSIDELLSDLDNVINLSDISQK